MNYTTVARLSDQNANIAWGTKKNLFPDAPAAIAPPEFTLQSITLNDNQNPTQRYPHDPNDPDFHEKDFYVEEMGKYKCPHKNCK